MADTTELRDLYKSLEEDQWRKEKENRFSEPLEIAQNVLKHPYSRDSDKIEALELWLQKHQPCIFGRMAAVTNGMHFCILTDEDLLQSDQHVAKRIQEGRLDWKRRSLKPIPGMALPAHGFMLLVASERLALARPDAILNRFSAKIRELWGCESTQTEHGIVSWESLFLQNPRDDTFLKFTFSIDYFAAQGDGRWWQDHRIPGGIAFTANSIGHMRHYREWYHAKDDQKTWALSTAMRTIDEAAETEFGRATWLLSLTNDVAIVKRIGCPFGEPNNAPAKLAGKDWTRYAGYLHTDHSIRSEFFRPEPEKSKDLEGKRWLEDFAYLYDSATGDHEKFMAGEVATEEDVVAAIGDPEDYTHLAGPIAADDTSDQPQNPEVEELLVQCRKWQLTPEELQELNLP